MELRGKRVLITGASRDIGEALAGKFTDAGATVALVARTRDALETLAARVGGTAHVADLSDPTQVADLIRRVEQEAGPVDVREQCRHGARLRAKSFERFYRTRLSVDVPREKVADEVVRAVQKGKKHVRLPRRSAASAMLAEAPRRATELALAGVRPREM